MTKRRSDYSKTLALILFAFGLAGCGEITNDQAQGGLSAKDAAELDNAAEMLDASPDDLSLPPETTTSMQGNSIP